MKGTALLLRPSDDALDGRLSIVTLVVDHTLERLFRLLEIVPVGDEGLQIYLPLADEIQRELVYTGAVSAAVIESGSFVRCNERILTGRRPSRLSS